MAVDLFEAAAERLEELTDLNRLEIRGTLRIALKEAGLEAKKLTFPQLTAVFEKIMPQMLGGRAVENSESICRAVMSSLNASGLESAATQTRSDEIFSRLGGS